MSLSQLATRVRGRHVAVVVVSALFPMLIGILRTEARATTGGTPMADGVGTRDALYSAIQNEIEKVAKMSSPAVRARSLADLSRAYRYLSGGPQPGGGDAVAAS